MHKLAIRLHAGTKNLFNACLQSVQEARNDLLAYKYGCKSKKWEGDRDQVSLTYDFMIQYA